MSIRGMIFDVDGTLLDTNRLHVEAWSHALISRGWNMPRERIAQEIGRGGPELLIHLLGDLPPNQTRYLGELHDEEFERLLLGSSIQTFPYTKLLKGLRACGIRMALCTGTGKNLLVKLLARADSSLPDYFDEIIAGDDTEQTKPHGEPLQVAARKLGLAATECAFVGDTPYDATSGLCAGIATLGVTTGVHDRRRLLTAGCRRVVDDLNTAASNMDSILQTLSPHAIPLSHNRLEQLMREAFECGKNGLRQNEKFCGAVIARAEGPVLACAHNEELSQRDIFGHAAFGVLHKLGINGGTKEKDLVLAVTHEPCPFCMAAARHLGVETVAYSLPIETPGRLPFGSERVQGDATTHWPRVVGGILQDECRALEEPT